MKHPDQSIPALQRFLTPLCAGLLFSTGGACLAQSHQEFVGDEFSKYFVSDAYHDKDWTRHFRVGALVGINLKAKFSSQGQFQVNGAGSGHYDDGYVLVDDTGNAGGLTGYWGYENASQYDSASHTLTFHQSDSYTVGARSGEASDSAVGFELAYGDTYWNWLGGRLGWEFGFGLLPLKIEQRQVNAAMFSRSSYTFDTGSIVVPGAPYSGGSSGVGEPVIGATPSSLTTDSVSGTVDGRNTLDATLFLFRLGPMMQWEIKERWAVSLSIGGAAGLVSGDCKFDESLTTEDAGSSRNKGSFSASDFVYGGGASVSVMYHWEKNGDIYIGAQYLPLSRAEFSSGQRKGSLEFGSALYFSAGINWPF